MNYDNYCVPNLATEEKINAIHTMKQELIETGTITQKAFFLREEVLDSWKRSLDYGLDPKCLQPIKPIGEEEFRVILEEKQALINAAEPLLSASECLACISRYVMCLTDENGVNLLTEGDKTISMAIEKYHSRVGSPVDEKHLGTTAHALVIHNGRPIQLVGPENFSDFLSENISSSAPIFDKNNQLVGTLTFILEKTSNPFSEETHFLQANALGWVIFMAQVITSQMNLQELAQTLSYSNQTLEVTLTYLDEGIAMVDCTGTILAANSKCGEILGLSLGNLHSANITSFFKKDSKLVELIFSGTRLDYVEDIILTQEKEHSFLISSRPILNTCDDRPQGAVIRISNIKNLHNHVVKQGSSLAHFTFEQILGQSESILAAKKVARIFARTTDNILLTGESGTGKELFAQSIHNTYHPKGPFIALNCAALPHNLVESELFGYEGGSFTGAERKGRVGKIEMANGGTLFLDEIGDMALDIQAVLLRVLEDKKVMRVGGNTYKTVDFRVIAASNQDLREMVDNKLFRADLYYRLSALTVNLPPLRQRGTDIVLLAETFIANYCKKLQGKKLELSANAKNVLLSYGWPGNVRQLEKAVIYAVNVAEGKTINENHLPEEIFSVKPTKAVAGEEQILTLQQVEEMQIRKALSNTDNNINLASKLLNIGKSTLYQKIKYYRINH